MANPVVVNRSMVLRALEDPSFFAALPQYAMLKSKLKMMGANEPTGCRGCRGRAVAQNILADFLRVTSILQGEDLNKLKRYFGVEKLMYSSHNPRTGGYESKII